MSAKDYVLPVVLGAGAGAFVGFIVWRIASNKVREELTTQIEQQVQPAVRTEIQRTLAENNITPETGTQISSILSALEQIGAL